MGVVKTRKKKKKEAKQIKTEDNYFMDRVNQYTHTHKYKVETPVL